MQVYTFRAGSLSEALAQVRRTLGPDATVLPGPRWTDPGWAGLGSRWVEVRALPPGDELPPSPSLASPVRHDPTGSVPLAVAAVAAPIDRGGPPPAAELGDYRRELRRHLDWAEDEPSLVEQLVEAETAENALARLRTRLARRLIDFGISPATCQRWLDRLQQAWTQRQSRADRSETRGSLARAEGWATDADEAAAQAMLCEVVARELPIARALELGTSSPLVVVLAGPTGVGKTTTIAKLAARFCQQPGCRVGLVAADPYRVGAIEQLRAYAQLMQLPLETADSPEGVGAARQRLSSCDLVLVDTSGVNPHDANRMAELSALQEAARPCELTLVLSATAHPRVLTDAAQAFRRLGATRWVLTKLDEAGACGPLLDWLTTCPLPLSYISAGQKVPEDLAVAAGHPLATELLRSAWASADADGNREEVQAGRQVPGGDAATYLPARAVAAFSR